MLDQLRAKFAAAAVAHHDGGIVGERQRAGPVGEVGLCDFFQLLASHLLGTDCSHALTSATRTR